VLFTAENKLPEKTRLMKFELHVYIVSYINVFIDRVSHVLILRSTIVLIAELQK